MTPSKNVKKAWLSVEDALIRENYQRLGAVALAEFMPGRAVHSIQKRASLLGVQHRTVAYRAGYPWPTDDMAPVWAAWRYPATPGASFVGRI